MSEERKIQVIMLDCPFCGFEGSHDIEPDSIGFHVECRNCGATSCKRKREEEAILEWNSRV